MSAWCFRNYALFPHLSVLDNVAYGLRASGSDEVSARADALDTLSLLAWSPRHSARRLNSRGGQQQRVALARALALKPSVLLFDEPLSNLDEALRRSVREEIRSLQQRLRFSVLYVTHDQTEAMAVSDRIAVMDRGRVVQVGTPRQLYETPATPFVAGFMGETRSFEAIVG